jgi:hypothetical protein
LEASFILERPFFIDVSQGLSEHGQELARASTRFLQLEILSTS